MADNTTLNLATNAGDVISTEDVSGVKIPRTKLVLGDYGVDGGNISTANPVPVSGSVGGRKVIVAATFSRPANTTAYSAGDMVSNSTTATTVMTFSNFARVSGGSGFIVGALLATNLKSITPRIRVHLFNDSSVTLAADKAAFKSLYADHSKHIGSFDLPAMTTPTDTAGSDDSRTLDMSLRVPFLAVGTRAIYAVLEALDAFTPASSQGFRLSLVGDLD